MVDAADPARRRREELAKRLQVPDGYGLPAHLRVYAIARAGGGRPQEARIGGDRDHGLRDAV
jgi:hypothetical protein